MGDVGVIDYGMGNLLSVKNALAYLGTDAVLVQKPSDIETCDRIILPGVGAFPDCIKNLNERNFVPALTEAIQTRGVPFLGICLGLQALATKGFEGGENLGLDWIKGEVQRIQPSTDLLIPHIGWNGLKFRRSSELFSGVGANADFYFVHSYSLHCQNPEDVVATVEYGSPLVAVIQRGNIVATQFHPEKSQDVGLRFLENFLNWSPKKC